MPWNAFICHASEDKDSFVRPLAEELIKRGIEIWYDEFTLRVGDSLRRSIDRGLAESDYGIVVLSPNFFLRKWPQDELDGLVARESIADQKVILPIWHEISSDEVTKYSPTLADKIASKSSDGIQCVVEHLLRVIRPELTSNAWSVPPAQKDTRNASWEDPLAPLTLNNLISYSRSKDPETDWNIHSPAHYNVLRRLHVNTMAQLIEAVENTEARKSLARIYQRLLGREPDWAGIFAYQPWIYLEGARGRELVEQAVLASDEYRRRRKLVPPGT
jgi:hypothetical protein